MTVQEALTQMHEVVGAAKERLEGNGFVMSIQTFYYDAMLRVIPNEKRARFATVTLIVNKADGKEGEEYCLSLGVAILGKKANAKRLAKDTELFQRYVDEAVETLAGFEDKNAGLDNLTARAEEEYAERMAQAKEQKSKNNWITTAFNVVFILIFIAIVYLLTRK